ncbi:transcriptional regulator [Bacillus coahuilensis m2-6]|uniref:XRE family transcriptional regulator n=1 Tax=Bacillus coahuilensis TaxID=408580 RepID=UPI00018513BA|nr:XRE family transcriptional regulator [Bacillus coahuilensis]KUP05115.1 transcriptional regulator [Bacillus coahuilensis m2-6]
MVGNRIRMLREERKLTMQELAVRSKVSKSYISSIERGLQKNPSIRILLRIADTLHVELEDLFDSTASRFEDTILDQEWVRLLEEAVSDGLTKQEFHTFINLMQYKRKHAEC